MISKITFQMALLLMRLQHPATSDLSFAICNRRVESKSGFEGPSMMFLNWFYLYCQLQKSCRFCTCSNFEERKYGSSFYFEALVVLNRILSNFQSFTCSTIAMDYRTLRFNASVKVVLENKKLDPHLLSLCAPHLLSSKFEHVQKRQLFCN